MRLRAFTVLEVLVSLMIISVIVVGGLMVSSRYALRNYWEELFQSVEQEFFTTNVYALSGVSVQGLDLGVSLDEEDLPEMHHLYFQTGNDGKLWYVETRQKEGGTSSQREVVFDEQKVFDLNYFKLNSLELFQDEETAVGVSEPAVLMTWTGPLAQLTFHFISSPLVGGSSFPAEFVMPDEPSHCVDTPDQCLIKTTFEDRAGNTKAMFIDLQKGVSKEFF